MAPQQPALEQSPLTRLLRGHSLPPMRARVVSPRPHQRERGGGEGSHWSWRGNR